MAIDRFQHTRHRQNPLRRMRRQVERDQQPLVAEAAFEHQQRLRRIQEFNLAFNQRRKRFAPAQEATREVQRRLWVGFLRGHAVVAMRWRDRQPRFAAAEAGLRIAVPWHRRAAAVAALEVRPERDAVGIAQCLEFDIHLWQAELFALVQAHGAAQRTDQCHQLHRESRCLVAVAPARHCAPDVVV